MSSNSEFIDKVKENVTTELVVKILIWLLGVVGLFFVWLFWSLLISKVSIPIIFFIGSFFLGIGVLYLIQFGIDSYSKSYKDYRKDDFWGITWTWNYKYRKKEVSKPSIDPICPECNSKMMPLGEGPDSTETYFTCIDDECDYYDMDDDSIMLVGTYEVIQERLSRKVDKNLRDKGLKI